MAPFRGDFLDQRPDLVNQYSTNPPLGEVPAAIFGELIFMVCEIMRDEAFLAQKAKSTTPEDLSIAQDLLDTLAVGHIAIFQTAPRACLKIVNTPKRRLFFRHTLPIFLGIHKVFLRQTGFVWRKNLSPLGIFPMFKQRLISLPQLQ